MRRVACVGRIVTIISVLFCFTISCAVWAQTNDLLDEIALGLSYKSAILATRTADPINAESAEGLTVLQSLLKTRLLETGPALPYEMTVLNDAVVNAFSTAGGKIYITTGILPVIRKEPGVWAAILSHELGHTVFRHQYHSYLRALENQRQIAYYRA